jgi:hypothetical protein
MFNQLHKPKLHTYGQDGNLQSLALLSKTLISLSFSFSSFIACLQSLNFCQIFQQQRVTKEIQQLII